MRYQVGWAVMLAMFAACGVAEGFGGRGRAGSVSYVYPAPVFVRPVWVVPAVVAVPAAPICAVPVPIRPHLISPMISPVISPTIAPAVPFATPRPAPPSPQTQEPPVQKTTEPPAGKTVEPPPGQSMSLSSPQDGQRAPRIVETRSPVSAPIVDRDRVRVGFWNVSGRDVEVVVAGKKHLLARDRALTVEVERQFSWNVVGRPAAQERVAQEKAFHEIILRE